jgi:hypothetical protein
MVSFQRFLAALGLAAIPVFAGCSSSSTTPNPFSNPTTPPTTPPIAMTRLYVANGFVSGHVQIFAPPFSAASNPAVEFQDGTSNDVDDIAFDAAGRLYVSNFAQSQVDVFAPPFTNTSTSTFSVGVNSGPEGIDLDPGGNLYVANRTAKNVTIYNAPLSGASTAATTISAGLAAPVGLKIRAGTLYVADTTNGVVAIYNPPFSNASAPTVNIPAPGAWGIAFDAAGNLWACARGLAACKEFVPPFSNSSTPAITVNTIVPALAAYPAFDSSGNLYVSDGSTHIQVFTAPLSNASAPAYQFDTHRSNGIRFGP